MNKVTAGARQAHFTNGSNAHKVSKKTWATGSFSAFSDISNYRANLAALNATPEQKVKDPFAHHAWVFASAWLVSTVAGQAPFSIFRETEETEQRRKDIAKQHGHKTPTRRHGKGRRAKHRYLNKSAAKKVVAQRKQLTPDENHELNDALLSPNPYQSGDQLWQTTFLWMAVRGEMFWVLTDRNDDFLVTAGQQPERIWPLSPDLFEPIQQSAGRGELVGWRFKIPNWMPQSMKNIEVNIPLEAVVQFKFANLSTLMRGQARISPALQAVLTDVMYHEYNRKLLENGGDPGGLIEYDAEMSADEEREYLESFDQRHGGPNNARRTALLSGGFKYTQVGTNPKDMEGLEQQRWDRESILAVQGTPPSTLGVTDFINYATQLGQDKNLWDKTIIPLLKLVETVLDGTLFLNQPDNIVGMFDLTDIEALRSGILDKTNIAKQLAGPELHVPPRIAFETVGLEVEEYPGDEDAFINPVLTTVEDSLEAIANPPEPVLPPAPPPAPPSEETRALAKVAHTLLTKRIARAKARRWDQFRKIQEPHEETFSRQYLQWVSEERRVTLALFDEQTKAFGLNNWSVIKQNEDLFITLPSEVLPLLEAAKNRLQFRVRPSYVSAQEEVIQFTIDGDLGGIPTFSLEEASMQEVLNSRETILLNHTPVTLNRDLNLTIAQGVQNGESIRQVRQRIVQVFDGQATPAKTLQIARTETAGLMNTTRDEMFKQQGFSKELWVTAGDENVRDDHVTFGNSGPQERGFNYMQLVLAGGILRYPNDPAAPVGQVVNCRCIKIPVE